MQTVVDTAAVLGSSREELWRHAMTDTFVSVSIGDFEERGAHGTIAAEFIGPMMVGHVHATGQDIHRTARHVSSAPAEFFQVAVMTAGRARMGQDDRQAVLAPGDLLVYETNRPFEWNFDSTWNTYVYSFAPDLIPLTPDQRRRLTARQIAGDGALAGLTARFLGDLAATGANLSPEESGRVVQHASDLLVTLLIGQSPRNDVVAGAIQRTYVTRAKDYIDRTLTDPDLDPATVAAAVGVSLRYLHKLFAAQGLGIAEYIRDQRLARVHRALRDPSNAARSIAALAASSGFSDLSGFNRAFHRKYHRTPRDVRCALPDTSA
jgi:AraC-like DNA-binding protein